jgi:hypothetical protein
MLTQEAHRKLVIPFASDFLSIHHGPMELECCKQHREIQLRRASVLAVVVRRILGQEVVQLM